MPKIYKRNCNTCGQYYEGQGDKYCSYSCIPDKKGKPRKILLDGSWYPKIPSLCLCECGTIIYGSKQYVSGHNLRLKNEKIKEKIKISNTKTFFLKPDGSKEIYPKIPVICYCMKPDCYEILWNGQNWVRGHKMKIFPINKNKKLSKEICQKMRESHLGEKNWLCQRELTEKQKEIFTKNLPSDVSEENNGNWQGGISFDPYCKKFNNLLKEQVRLRDNHICQLCGKIHKEGEISFTAHHIHYDKPNCYPDLICLCISCNSKVNKPSMRKYYESLFMNKLNDKRLLFWTRRRDALKTNNLNNDEFILLRHGEMRQV